MVNAPAQPAKPVLLSKEEMYDTIARGGTINYAGRLLATREAIDSLFGQMAEKEEDVEKMEEEADRLEAEIADSKAKLERLAKRIPEVRKAREARLKAQDQHDKMRAMHDSEKAVLLEANATLQAQLVTFQEQLKKAGIEPELVQTPGAEVIVNPPESGEPPKGEGKTQEVKGKGK